MDDDISKLITFIPVSNAGLYTLCVGDPGQDNQTFVKQFERYVSAIQTHGYTSSHGEVYSISSSLVHDYSNMKVYINADLFRNQMEGIVKLWRYFGVETKDLSDTGAARTVVIKPSALSKPINKLVSEFISVLPDIEMDYVPQFRIPYKYLPNDLKQWEERTSHLLTEELKDRIKLRGGILVAKTYKNGECTPAITWRLSISPMDIINEESYQGCNVTEVLVILKDLLKIVSDKIPKEHLWSYCIKTSMIWCMHEQPDLGKSELLARTLDKLVKYYQNAFLPDFFNDKFNLIEHIPKHIAWSVAKDLEVLNSKLCEYLIKCIEKQNAFQREYCKKVSSLNCIALLLLMNVSSSFAANSIKKALSKYIGQMNFSKTSYYNTLITSDLQFQVLLTNLITAAKSTIRQLPPVEREREQRFSTIEPMSSAYLFCTILCICWFVLLFLILNNI